jgi:hypothetical protein
MVSLTEQAHVVLAGVLLGVIQDEAARGTCLAHLKLTAAAAAGGAAAGAGGVSRRSKRVLCKPVV